MDEPIKPIEVKQCVPKILPIRNAFGLLDNIDYSFNEDSTINWRRMIPPEFLYVNPDPKRREKLEAKYKKPYSEIRPIDDNVEDGDLIQLLGAAKYLLKTYGYDSIHYTVVEANQDYAAVNCQIDFIGNYLTQNRPISYEDCACAHGGNTNDFGTRYLIEMATNRSFVRCIRNFLGIGIISKEEISGNVEPEQPKSTMAPARQIKMLDDIMADKGVTWPHLVEKLKKENLFKDEYLSTKDLPKDVVFQFVERIKKMPSV